MSKNIRKILMILVTLLMAAGIVFLIAHLTKSSGSVINGVLTEQTELEGKKGTYGYTGLLGEVLIAGNQNGVAASDRNGSPMWNESYDMGAPIWLQTQTYGAVYDVGGCLAIIFDEKGAIGRIDLGITEEILFACMNEQGSLLILSQRNTSTQHLTLFDRTGNRQLQRTTQIVDDGFAMTAAMSSDASRIATAFVNYKEDTVNSVVCFYELDQGNDFYGDRMTANYVYDGEVIDALEWTEEGWVASGDTAVHEYTNEEKPVECWTLSLTNRIQKISVGKLGTAILFGEEISHNNSSLQNTLVVYDHAGIQVYSQQMQMCSYLQWQGEELICSETDQAVSMDLSGTIHWRYSCGSDRIEQVQRIISMGNNEFAWCERNGMRILIAQKAQEE